MIVRRRVPVLILAAIVVMLSWAAIASGKLQVGVSPSELEYVVSPGESVTRDVYVFGGNESTQVYAAAVREAEYRSWFTIEPGNITVLPETYGTIKVAVSPPTDARGDHSATIGVRCQPSVGGLGMGVGVQIPAHISISAPGGFPVVAVAAPLGVLLVGVGAFLAIRRFGRRRVASPVG